MPVLYYSFINICSGILLLFMGLPFFWLFVGLSGFLFGRCLVDYLIIFYPDFFIFIGERIYWALHVDKGLIYLQQGYPEVNAQAVIIIMTYVFGLSGLHLCRIFRNEAIIISGALSGCAFLYTASFFLLKHPTNYVHISLFAGSALGMISAFMFAEYAIIVFSALIGVLLLFQPFYEDMSYVGWVMGVVLCTGIFSQVMFLKKAVRKK